MKMTREDKEKKQRQKDKQREKVKEKEKTPRMRDRSRSRSRRPGDPRFDDLLGVALTKAIKTTLDSDITNLHHNIIPTLQKTVALEISSL